MANEAKGPDVPPSQEHGGPEVFVEDLNTSRDVQFHASWSDTLQSIWDTAYAKLNEGRRDRDQFETNDGKALTGFLSLTLEEYRNRHIGAGFHFQIKGDTGGA
jgi:hypothetical protein